MYLVCEYNIKDKLGVLIFGFIKDKLFRLGFDLITNILEIMR